MGFKGEKRGFIGCQRQGVKLTDDARTIWISNKTRRTLTGGIMRNNNAKSIICTDAGVDTALVLTGQILRTIIIGGTLWTFTLNERVSSKRCWTRASCSMVIVGMALGIHTTLGKGAGVYAFSVDACLHGRAP